jgi:acyl-CoA synthetase (NDP forming)
VHVPELPVDVQSALAEFLPAAASLGNPVDMIASATAADYRRTLQTLLDAEVCDAILAIFVPPLVTDAVDVAAAISGLAQTAPEMPIAAVFMTADGPPAELGSGQVRVPGYEFPEDAARAVALAAKYGRWRARPEAVITGPAGTDPDRAAAIISRELASGSGWLSPGSVVALLECYRLPLIPTQVVSDADGAVTAAAELGGAVAIKASAQGLLHKSDAGGVRLGLDGAAAVRSAASEIEAAVTDAGHQLDGLIVQPMAPVGVELIIGVVNDHSFGPVLACGAGGTIAELINDVAVRITPITDSDAGEMLRSLRTFPLLDGYRAAPRCDLGAIEDALRRVSAMVEAHPEIVELDCNPLIAGPDGAVIVDARVRVEVAPPPPPMPSLGA